MEYDRSRSEGISRISRIPPQPSWLPSDGGSARPIGCDERTTDRLAPSEKTVLRIVMLAMGFAGRSRTDGGMAIAGSKGEDSLLAQVGRRETLDGAVHPGGREGWNHATDSNPSQT